MFSRKAEKPETYIQVLGWWVPLLMLFGVAFFLVYDDLLRNGDASGLTAEYIPTTKSKGLGAGIFLFLLLFSAGVYRLALVYRIKRRKSQTHIQK